MSEIRLILPLPPNRANAREHWRVTHRKKKAYYELVQASLAKAPLSWAAACPTLTATLYVWAKMDPDNCVARLKWPIDMLVGLGYLIDDSEDYLDFTQIPKQVIDRKNPRVEIALEEVSDG